MASGNAENKIAFENGTFLKVDCVETVYDGGYSFSGCTPRINGIKVWLGDHGYIFPCDCFTICEPDVVREDAYRQAFALMAKICYMDGSERRCAFGESLVSEIVKGATYDDLAKKLDAWKKEKETIRVRDEVYHQSMQVRFVVTKIFVPSGGEDATVNGIKKDGTTIKGLLLHNVKKTGVHVDDLDAYLEV